MRGNSFYGSALKGLRLSGRLSSAAKNLALPSIFHIGAFLYVAVLVVRLADPSTIYVFGFVNTLAQTLLGLVVARGFIRVRSRQKHGPRAWSFLLTAFLFVSCADFVYGWVVNVTGLVALRGTWVDLGYNGLYFIFWACSSLAFFPFMRAMPSRVFVTGVAGFLLYCAALYSSLLPLLLENPQGLVVTAVHIASFACRGFVLVSAILCAALNRSKGLQTLSLGYILLAGYGLAITHLELLGSLQAGLPSEALWAFALLVCHRATVALETDSDFSLVNTRSIKSSLLLLCFGACGVFAVVAFVYSFLTVNYDLPWTTLTFSCLAILAVGLFVLGEFGVHVVDSQFAPIRSDWRKAEQLAEKATRLCHDIKSPLCALSLLNTDSQLSKEGALRGKTTRRIIDLVETYLSDYRWHEAKRTRLAPILEQILLEKRLTHPNFESIFSIQAEERGMEAPMSIDPAVLGAALSNFLDNAIEAVNAVLPPRQKKILLQVRSEHDMIHITIEDTAGGIPDVVLKSSGRLSPHSEKINGNGIGLSTSLEAIRATGGSASASNSGFGGLGAAVSLRVPLAVGGI